ncbi:DNA polymerase I [Gordonia phage Wooper]|nr:DNA polymerase I [Gordonia phage Wooper]
MPNVPDRTWYDPVLDAVLHTGRDAVDAVVDLGHTTAPGSVDIATDIETPGLSRQFDINCVTAAWRGADGRVHSVLLDPDRREGDDVATRYLYDHARRIILHNAPFDTPALVRSGLLDLHGGVDKIIDTLLLARYGVPDNFIPKKLEALAVRHLGLDDFKGGMETAFKAAGFKTIQAGYEGMDIDSPVYRQGAMADTVATLALEPVLRDAALDLTLDHPFSTRGATTRSEAAEILGVQERVNQIMLRRTAVGIEVDNAYLDRYTEEVRAERKQAEQALAAAGLEGGSGKGGKIVEYLADHGELPEPWPRTPTGKLKATKDLLDDLDHPLAAAQRTLAETDKVLGYIAAVESTATVTGRCHPQCGVLGASTTGRMSYSNPALQQFSANARPILVDPENTLWSIDWSQIEPVTMANMAHDEEFLAPFEQGEDLYEPIQRAAGIDRKMAKVVLLATMYGQGIRSLSAKIGHTEESASQIRRQMISAMPMCGRFMSQVSQIAETHGRIVTVGGRILPVDAQAAYKAVNYIIQGSAADVLNLAIKAVDDAGLGDCIELAMHDELVISGDEEQAAEVERIMQTPPDRLVEWSQRTPILRTDRQSMGHTWLKV